MEYFDRDGTLQEVRWNQLKDGRSLGKLQVSTNNQYHFKRLFRMGCTGILIYDFVQRIDKIRRRFRSYLKFAIVDSVRIALI